MKQNNFGAKNYGKGQNITEKANVSTRRKQNYKDWEKALRRNYTTIHSEQH